VRTVAWCDAEAGLYRRLVVRQGRLVGALAIGAWPELSQIQQAVRNRVRTWPWQMWRFARSGRLYANAPPAKVEHWPAAATVCNCTGVDRGQLGEAIGGGAITIETLMRATGASTVCGTCRPLLHELLGGKVMHEPVFGARTIVVGSLVAALVALVAIVFPPWPYSRSVVAGIGIDWLWTDGGWKQLTGFTLLGLAALVAFLSVRKRVGLKWLGEFRFWRIVHTSVGAGALAVLFLHTGFNLGSNLNRWLMASFLAVAVLGGVTGIVTGREHSALNRGRRSLRAATAWLHILAFWPLPLLLLLHVVTVYAY
jgi:nitrite reductase (NADH) large subunit